LKASRAPYEKSQGSRFPFASPGHSWLGTAGLAVAIGIAYFVAAQLGLALRAKPGGVAVFWPAAGVAIGALITLGPNARVPVAAAVAVATIASKLMITGNLWLGIMFGLVCAGQTLLTAWLIERWFGRAFKLEDVPQVLGFLVASAVGAAMAALGVVAAVSLVVQLTAPPLDVWRHWFASCLLGTVTVAPLLIGLGEAVRELPPRRELIEGTLGVATLAALSVFVISLPQGSWATAVPVALVFPLLLWIAVRCRPVFAAAATLVVGLTVIWSTTFNWGHFGDSSIPLADRILAAQTFVLVGALLTFVLAALFAERRQREAALELSNERLELALGAAELGAFSLDLDTGCLECDAHTAHIHGHVSLPKTIKDGRRFVHPDDRVCIDTPFAEAQNTGGVWGAKYRVVHPPGHPHAGEVRWVAFEGSTVRGAQGTPVRLLGISRDITQRKRAEQALEERNVQRELAEKAGLVGSYAYDVDTEKARISEGYAAIQGYPEGTAEITRSAWLAGVHPDDIERLDGLRSQAFRERKREYNMEYRIVRSGGVRWIESRSFISYDSDGRAQRLIGVNIDVTERKQTEARLADLNAQFDLAHKAARVGSYTYDMSARTMRFSRASMASHGLSQSSMEITAQQWFARVHRDDRQRLRAEHIRAFKERRPELINEFRIVRPGGEVRWIEGRSLVVYDHAGRAERMTGVYIDVTERKQTEALLSESKARLADAMAAGQVMAFEWDAVSGLSQRGDNAAHILGFEQNCRASVTRNDFLRHVHPDDRVSLKTRIRGLQPGNPSYVLSFRFVRPDGREVWLEETAKAEFDAAGRLLRIKGLTRDITERKALEEDKNLLIAELDHRVKNVLSIVSVVASRTQETSHSMADFVTALDGRIRSMATTHELLSYRRWHGIPLAELVQRELAPYATGSNTQIEGPDVMLTAKVGQAIAMVFHELATNAAKFGALSATGGRVCVRWSHKRNGHAHSLLSIHWEERGGPNVVPQTRSGYGTSVIRDLVPYELGGTVDLVHAPEGVRCRLEIPAHWLSNPPSDLSMDPRLRHYSVQGGQQF
jgi:PAS domain S-box-containing protein